MTTVNPLWHGRPEAELGRLLIARDAATAKAECERIMAEIRAATYADLDAKFPDRNSVDYDDAFDAAFQQGIRAYVTEMLAAPSPYPLV